MARHRLEELIEEHPGRIFSVLFKKKDGSMRRMVCRTGVKKGVTGKGLAFDPRERDLLPVFDMEKDGFRFVNLSEVREATVAGRTYTFEVRGD